VQGSRTVASQLRKERNPGAYVKFSCHLNPSLAMMHINQIMKHLLLICPSSTQSLNELLLIFSTLYDAQFDLTQPNSIPTVLQIGQWRKDPRTRPFTRWSTQPCHRCLSSQGTPYQIIQQTKLKSTSRNPSITVSTRCSGLKIVLSTRPLQMSYTSVVLKSNG